MLKPRTHFEQVPLETVRKIVEEQIALEITTKQDQETSKKKLENDLIGGPGTADSKFPHVFSGGVT